MTYAAWVTQAIQEAHQEAITAYGVDDPGCIRLAALLAGGGIEAGKGWAVLRLAVERWQRAAPADDDCFAVTGDDEPDLYGTPPLYGDPDQIVYVMLRGAALTAGSHPLLSGRITPKQRGELAGKAVQHLRAAVDVLGVLGVRVHGWDADGLGNAYYALGNERYCMIGTTPEDFAKGPEVLDGVRGVLERLLKADLLADVVLPVALEKLDDLAREPLPPRVADDGALEKKIVGCVMERECVWYFRKPYRASVAALVGAMFGDYDFDDERLKAAIRYLGPYLRL